MRKVILLAILLICTMPLCMGCNGADLQNPSGNPLPGQGTNDPEDLGKGILAIDVYPQREMPEQFIIEDPDWEPAFDSLVNEPTCINEGCIRFKLEDFNEEERIATFKGTFFNPNKDSMKNLTVLLVITQTARGITPIEYEGMWKLDEFDTVAYPCYAFSYSNNEEQTPGSMYCYFEREISFLLEEGSDFNVDYEIVALYDKNDLSYTIDVPDPYHEDNETGSEGEGGSGDGRTGGTNGAQSGGSQYQTPVVHPPDG
jgi:hypothetical protein